jgi:hypothetical protein
MQFGPGLPDRPPGRGQKSGVTPEKGVFMKKRVRKIVTAAAGVLSMLFLLFSGG